MGIPRDLYKSVAGKNIAGASMANLLRLAELAFKTSSEAADDVEDVGKMSHVETGGHLPTHSGSTLPKANSSPLKIGFLPQMETHLPTIHFQVPC